MSVLAVMSDWRSRGGFGVENKEISTAHRTGLGFRSTPNRSPRALAHFYQRQSIPRNKIFLTACRIPVWPFVV
jgi:hypothetical protein